MHSNSVKTGAPAFAEMMKNLQSEPRFPCIFKLKKCSKSCYVFTNAYSSLNVILKGLHELETPNKV